MTQSSNCWHCDGIGCMVDVVDSHPYRKCSHCGATAVDIGILSSPAFTERVVLGAHGNIERKPYLRGRRKREAKHD